MREGLVVSVEVIRLLKWIIERGANDLAIIIDKAIADGSLNIDENERFDSEKNLNDFQAVILGIIDFLEKSIDKHIVNTITIAPAAEELICKLNSCKLDPELIVSTIRTASINVKNNARHGMVEEHGKVVKNMMFNLLRKWKPAKDDAHS